MEQQMSGFGFRRKPIAHMLAAVVFLIAAGAATRSDAHPHVWVDATATINANAEGIARTVTVTYALDDMTTSFLVEGIGRDEKGEFLTSEMRDLASENANALSEFDYFIELLAAGRRIATPTVASHDYAYQDGRLVLSLTLSLEEPIEVLSERITVLLYDPSFYVLVQPVQGRPLRVAGLPENACRATVKGPSLASDGITLTDSMLEDLGASTNVGRDYADQIALTCAPQS